MKQLSLFLIGLGTLAAIANPFHPSALSGQSSSLWVGSWASSQQLVELSNAIPPVTLRDGTLRQIVHLSIGGAGLRVQLSNRFGAAPLRIDSVHVARSADPATAKIVNGTDTPVQFFGNTEVTIPPGADYISDPVTMPVVPQSDLAVTLHMEEQPSQQTGHPGSRATSYVVPGNHVADADFDSPLKIDHWYFLAGIDVPATSPRVAAVVTLGDSITDGHGATTNGNDRWPDILVQRLDADQQTHDISVLNQGIGGNRVLLNGIGPNALARFNSDVLAQPGARFLIILEGVNDLGVLAREHDVPKSEHDVMVAQIESAFQQMVTRGHECGMRVIGATILPFAGSEYYHPGPATEADRRAINDWIRAKGNFDAVIDFDQVTRDPQNPTHLLPEYDSGDHLHPSPAGYAAMARSIPLSLFAPKAISPH